MKLKLSGYSLIVTKEDSDKKFYGTGGALGESNFLYALKNELNRKGFNLIKKRMWKDGHLVDDIQQYLRTSNRKTDTPHVYFYSGFFAIRGLNDDFNEGEVSINIETDVYNKQPDCMERLKKIFA